SVAVTTNCVTAVAMAATAIPEIMTFDVDDNPLPVDNMTTPIAMPAPASAPTGVGIAHGNSDATATPAPAPAASPSTSGLPNGLRVTFWNSAPESPKAAPAMMAISTLGPRTRWNTNSVVALAWPLSRSMKSAGLSPSLPSINVATASDMTAIVIA